jgi:hypothetical protein
MITTKRTAHLLVIELLLSMIISSCRNALVTPTKPTQTFTPQVVLSTVAPSRVKSTAYAQQPAAGICASFEGTVVTITINPDIPDPRCAKIKPEQTLTVVNNTHNTLQVSLSEFTTSVEPGDTTVIKSPFGDYLEPGVHQLQVTPCCGAELWLEATK